MAGAPEFGAAAASAPTYLVAAAPASDDELQGAGPGGPSGFSTARAVVSFFAVVCPDCNKLSLLALGTSGAV